MASLETPGSFSRSVGMNDIAGSTAMDVNTHCIDQSQVWLHFVADELWPEDCARKQCARKENGNKMFDGISCFCNSFFLFFVFVSWISSWIFTFRQQNRVTSGQIFWMNNSWTVNHWRTKVVFLLVLSMPFDVICAESSLSSPWWPYWDRDWTLRCYLTG